MVNNEELLYVVDEFNEKVKPQPRHKVFKNGLWRRTTHVWIFDKKGRVLVQRRSLKKTVGPGLWESSVAGHIGPDDNYFTGAVREVREETGIDIDPKDLKLHKIYKDHDRREFIGVFYHQLDIDENKIKMEEDEVEEVKLIDKDLLKKHIVYRKSEYWIKYGYEKEMFALLN